MALTNTVAVSSLGGSNLAEQGSHAQAAVGAGTRHRCLGRQQYMGNVGSYVRLGKAGRQSQVQVSTLSLS